MNVLVKPNSYPWNHYHRLFKAVLASPDVSISYFSSSSAPESAELEVEEIKRSNPSPRKFKSPVPIIPLSSRISKERDPLISISSILDHWIIEVGLTYKLSQLHNLTKKLICRGRFDHALEVSEWMSRHRGNELSAQHFAARLDLILKVHGLEQAEEYFNSIPDTSKSYRVCIVLLLKYINAKQFDKADILMQKMRDMRIKLTEFAYNAMLHFCVEMQKHEKLALLAEEMEEKGFKFETINVHGLEQLANKYFNIIPDTSKRYRVCNVLLIRYANTNKLDKAELLMKKMRDMGIILTPYACSEMLNLYAKEGKHEKLALLAEEMEEKGIKFETRRLNVHHLKQLFNSIPDTSKGYQVCNVLLIYYADANWLDDAELVMKKMRDMGIILTAYAYNEMLNLYAKKGKHEKLALLAEEMEEKGIIFNVTCEIRLHAYVASGDIEGMEKYLMKINIGGLSVCAYSFVAYGYLKAGLIDKALTSLKESERIAKHNMSRCKKLMTLYAACGNKAEVYRVWNLYKQKRCYNTEYIAMISSLVKLDDMDGAEKILEEWWDSTTDMEFDIRVPNLMISAYSRKGCWEKAEEYTNEIIKRGKDPNAASWEALATGYILGGRMLEAVDAMKKAITTSKHGWSPTLHTLAACVKYLEDQGDKEAAEELRQMITEHCHLSPDERTRLSRLYEDGELTSNAVELQMEDDQICIDITRFYYDW